MKQRETLEEESIDEVLSEVTPEPEFLIEPVEKLTLKQIVLLTTAGIVSFLFFIMLLFPYDIIVKNIIYKANIPGFSIDFTSLDFPFIGKKVIHSLSLQTSGGTNIKAEEFIIDISLFSFLTSKNIMGEFKLNSSKIENDKIGINLKTVFTTSELTGTEALNQLKGDLAVRISGGSIYKLPDIPLIGQLDKINLNNSILHFKIQNGNMVFQKESNLNTSIAKIFITGNIQLNPNISFSSINLSFCPKFKPEFATERPDIVNTLQILPKNADGQNCIPLTGTFQNPQLNLDMDK